MDDNLIDHEMVRARVEKRLEPRLQLLRQRMWLLAHIGIFILVFLAISGAQGNPLFYSTITHTNPGITYTNPSTGLPSYYPSTSYDIIEPYLTVSLAGLVWFAILIVHILQYWSAARRERIIEREIERERELEKLRLQAEIARASADHEKPKREMSLSDEGELVFNDEKPLRRNKSGSLG